MIVVSPSSKTMLILWSVTMKSVGIHTQWPWMNSVRGWFCSFLHCMSMFVSWCSRVSVLSFSCSLWGLIFSWLDAPRIQESFFEYCPSSSCSSWSTGSTERNKASKSSARNTRSLSDSHTGTGPSWRCEWSQLVVPRRKSWIGSYNV